MMSSELRGASCEGRVASCELRVARGQARNQNDEGSAFFPHSDFLIRPFLPHSDFDIRHSFDILISSFVIPSSPHHRSPYHRSFGTYHWRSRFYRKSFG